MVVILVGVVSHMVVMDLEDDTDMFEYTGYLKIFETR